MQKEQEAGTTYVGGEKRPALVETLYERTVTDPEKAAFVRREGEEWRPLSYGDFWRRVERFASGLARLGVGRGSRVAIVSGNRPEWPIGDLAVQSLGGVVVPVYPTLEEEQIGYILGHSGAGVAIVEGEELLRKVREAGEGLSHLVSMEGSTGVLSFGEVEALGEEEPLGDAWEEGWRSLRREDVATVIYTSGTTGRQKGAVLTHGNILSNLEGIRDALPVVREDVFLSFLPLSHVFERTCSQFLSLYVGATTYYAESMEKIPENLREVRPTLMLCVPRLYEKMYERVREQGESGGPLRRALFERAVEAGREKYRLEREGREPGALLRARLALYDKLVYRRVREATGGRVRCFVSGGAKLEQEVGEFFYACGVRIVEGYGLTETSPVICCNRLPVPRFGTVGRPIFGTSVRISEEGEIQVKGPGVTGGYLDDEEATREAFTEDGWFRTGDMGEFDAEGHLRVTGRLKHILVLSTGKNVAPEPVEAAIAAQPHVLQAVLLGDGRKYVAALVVPDYDAVRRTLGVDDGGERLAQDERCREIVGREIEEACRRFAPYERPKKFALLPRELSVEEGELTPTLKVRMHVVRERYAREIESLYQS